MIQSIPDCRASIPTAGRRVTAALTLALTLLPGLSGTAAEPLLPAGSSWRYLNDYPKPGWTDPGFDDTGWSEGRGGFGDGEATGREVRCRWHAGQIWLRRSVNLEQVPAAPQLRILHRAELKVFVNGHPVADFHWQPELLDW